VIEWLLLLLPVAAASGWWAAKRSGVRPGVSDSTSSSTSDSAFFQGLNYLLDEQPDKAIDIFVKLAEVDGETAEIHLALGSLFRRRGEVDRAIRIHRNLISRPHLGQEKRGYVLCELGQDYMRAGLLDRAERIFNELVAMKLHRKRALKGLREIYQQEKDWPRCLEVVEQLQQLTGESLSAECAQYHCELAEESLRQGKEPEVAIHLGRAQEADPDCVRATMLQARIAMGQGDSRTAARFYRRVVRQGPQFLPEVLPDLMATYRCSGSEDALGELERLYRVCPSPALVMRLTDTIRKRRGDKAAIAFLVEHVAAHADLASLALLLTLHESKLTDDARIRTSLQAALAVVEHLCACQPDYQCDHCGFLARRLHWQCPSCRHWGSIQPVQPEFIGDRADRAPASAYEARLSPVPDVSRQPDAEGEAE